MIRVGSQLCASGCRWVAACPARTTRRIPNGNERLPAPHVQEAERITHVLQAYCLTASDREDSRTQPNVSGDAWPDDVRLSDIEARFVCRACGKRGADVRPDFNSNRQPTAMMGYR